jgi:hypothetical protein
MITSHGVAKDTMGTIPVWAVLSSPKLSSLYFLCINLPAIRCPITWQDFDENKREILGRKMSSVVTFVERCDILNSELCHDLDTQRSTHRQQTLILPRFIKHDLPSALTTAKVVATAMVAWKMGASCA